MQDGKWLEVTHAKVDFDALLSKFRSAESLPDLPASALQLCDAIDKGDATNSDLERIILADPAITACVLRTANSAMYGGRSQQTSTVKGSILMLGHKAVRSVAVSVWVQSLVHQSKSSPKFDAARFAEHSMFVGFLSKYLLSALHKTKGVATAWSPDELFAAGVLHDLGLGLLASIEPALFDRVVDHAAANGLPLQTAFESVTERRLGILSVAAAQAWKLPDLFIDVLMGFEEPLSASAEVDSLCCLHYANHLADITGHSMNTWRVEPVIEQGVVDRVGLASEDIPDVLELVAAHTKDFVAAA